MEGHVRAVAFLHIALSILGFFCCNYLVIRVEYHWQFSG